MAVTNAERQRAWRERQKAPADVTPVQERNSSLATLVDRLYTTRQISTAARRELLAWLLGE